MTIEGPTLFMSNHRDPITMWPRLIDFGQKYPDTSFVCNASFSFFLNIFGIPTISISTKKYLERLDNTSASIKSILINTLGIVTARNLKIIEGEDVVDLIVDKLCMGKNVFIFPETVTGNRTGWRSGVGRVCKKVDMQKIHAGFVYIPKPIYEGTKVIIEPVLESLISDRDIGAIDISRELQRQHEQHFGLIKS